MAVDGVAPVPAVAPLADAALGVPLAAVLAADVPLEAVLAADVPLEAALVASPAAATA